MRRISTFQLYLAGIVLLFAGYVVLEYNQPKPIDWNTTYINKDKIPYGTYVLFDQLPRLLGTADIEVVRRPAFGQLTGQREAEALLQHGIYPDRDEPQPDEEYDQSETEEEELTATDSTPASDSTGNSATQPENLVVVTEEDEPDLSGMDFPLRDESANYIFINETFNASQLDAQVLLNYVARGNDVFIAAEQFGGLHSTLSDSLGVSSRFVELPTLAKANKLLVSDSVDIHFTNPAVAGPRYRLPGAGASHRLYVDSARTGRTLAADAQGRAVFVRLNHGAGHFYICTVPLAFTNYFFLQPRTQGFATAALSYLPIRPTWWDEFQKQGPVGEQSLLRVLLAHDALRTAYYLTLAGSLLFVLVYSRRRQRIIPIIKSLPNTTLQFTRTVAGLYRQGSNHALIGEKKVGLFLDYLRTRFHETSPDLGDNEFQERLSQKAGLPLPRVQALLRQVNYARTAPQMTDQQLLKLSRALSDFRREAR